MGNPKVPTKLLSACKPGARKLLPILVRPLSMLLQCDMEHVKFSNNRMKKTSSLKSCIVFRVQGIINYLLQPHLALKML